MTVRHILIESLDACDAAAAAGAGPSVWWTTSPAVLRTLAARGESVRSPEEGLTAEQFDALANGVALLSRHLCTVLASRPEWPEWVNVRQVFDLQIYRSLFGAVYKALLLQTVQKQAEGSEVWCVGDPVPARLPAAALGYDRLETVFSQIGGLLPSGVRVIPATVSDTSRRAVEKALYQGPVARIEKILSFLHNTPSSFFYKLWRRLPRSLRDKGACLSLRPSKTIFIHKDCELLEEAFLALLRRGVRLRRLPPLPRFPDLTVDLGAPLSPDLSPEIPEDVRAVLSAAGIAWSETLSAGLVLGLKRVDAVVAATVGGLATWQDAAAAIVAQMQEGDEVLSSSLNSLSERLFIGFARHKGIRTNTVDHGVTLGLSEWSVFHAPYTGMGISDRGFYHCQRAADLMQGQWPGHQAYAVGLPQVTVKPAFPRLYRWLARRLLGVSAEKQVVMIVADLPRNNFIYGPSQDNDLKFLTKTEQLIEAVCKAFPAAAVVLKLYPAERYADPYDFSHYLSVYPNLRINSATELRFVRYAADFILTSSSQSTLGWVHGSGVPYVYVDYSWAPGKISGSQMMFPDFPNLDLSDEVTLIVPGQRQVCDANAGDLASVLLEKG